ncbi:hypothetical protein ACO2FJ_10045 [Staphylococcus warneri]
MTIKKDRDRHDDYTKDEHRQDSSKDRQDELKKGHHDEEHHDSGKGKKSCCNWCRCCWCCRCCWFSKTSS